MSPGLPVSEQLWPLALEVFGQPHNGFLPWLLISRLSSALCLNPHSLAIPFCAPQDLGNLWEWFGFVTGLGVLYSRQESRIITFCHPWHNLAYKEGPCMLRKCQASHQAFLEVKNTSIIIWVQNPAVFHTWAQSIWARMQLAAQIKGSGTGFSARFVHELPEITFNGNASPDHSIADSAHLCRAAFADISSFGLYLSGPSYSKCMPVPAALT